jgi:hypothetical protein
LGAFFVGFPWYSLYDTEDMKFAYELISTNLRDILKDFASYKPADAYNCLTHGVLLTFGSKRFPLGKLTPETIASNFKTLFRIGNEFLGAAVAGVPLRWDVSPDDQTPFGRMFIDVYRGVTSAPYHLKDKAMAEGAFIDKLGGNARLTQAPNPDAAAEQRNLYCGQFQFKPSGSFGYLQEIADHYARPDRKPKEIIKKTGSVSKPAAKYSKFATAMRKIKKQTEQFAMHAHDNVATITIPEGEVHFDEEQIYNFLDEHGIETLIISYKNEEYSATPEQMTRIIDGEAVDKVLDVKPRKSDKKKANKKQHAYNGNILPRRKFNNHEYYDFSARPGEASIERAWVEKVLAAPMPYTEDGNLDSWALTNSTISKTSMGKCFDHIGLNMEATKAPRTAFRSPFRQPKTPIAGVQEISAVKLYDVADPEQLAISTTWAKIQQVETSKPWVFEASTEQPLFVPTLVDPLDDSQYLAGVGALKVNYNATNVLDIADTYEARAVYLPMVQSNFVPQFDLTLMETLQETASEALMDEVTKQVESVYYSYGTQLGQARRFKACMEVHEATAGLQYKCFVDFLGSPNLSVQFDDIEHYGTYIRGPEAIQLSNGSSLGPLFGDAKRNVYNKPLEAKMAYKYLKSLIQGAPTANRKELLDHLFLFEMKPKLEVVKREKYWNKTRSIFAGNSIAMMPFHYIIDGAKPDYKAGSQILLGCDPSEAFWACVSTAKPTGSWFIYSDNIYWFNDKGDFLDLDGKAMESSIQKNHYEAMFKKLQSDRVKDNSFVLSKEDFNLLKDVGMQDDGEGGVTFPTPGVPLYPSAGRVRQWLDEHRILDHQIEFLCLMAGVRCAVTEEGAVMRLTFRPPTGTQWMDKMIEFYCQLPAKARCLSGEQCFRIPFMPSGNPATAILNTIVSYNAIRDDDNKERSKDQVVALIGGAKWQQKYRDTDGSLKRGLGCWLTKENEGNLYQVDETGANQTPDFLGFEYHHQPFPHLELRHSSLFGAIFYKDPRRQSLQFSDLVSWNTKRAAELAACLLNGACFYPALVRAIAQQYAELLHYSSNNAVRDQLIAMGYEGTVTPSVKSYVQMGFGRLVKPGTLEEPAVVQALQKSLEQCKTESLMADMLSHSDLIEEISRSEKLRPSLMVELISRMKVSPMVRSFALELLNSNIPMEFKVAIHTINASIKPEGFVSAESALG